VAEQSVFNPPQPLTIMLYDNIPHLRREGILSSRRPLARPFVKYTGKWYLWNPASVADDDGDEVVKPESVSAGQPGRWIKDAEPSGGGTSTANGYFPMGWL
jgi:hypothetical protein